MNFTEPQISTIQERQIDLPVNKLEYLALYNSRKTENSSCERVLINIESYTFVFGRTLFSEKIMFEKLAYKRTTYCSVWRLQSLYGCTEWPNLERTGGEF